MLKQTLKSLTLVLLITATLGSMTACSSQKKKTGSEGTGTDGISTDSSTNPGGASSFEINGDSDSKKAGGLVTVYFDYNSAALTNDTTEALQTNLAFLKANPTVKVQVEGHCDERGSVQFNLALGERRAKTVREYLLANGIEGGRITTISLGKERPVAFGHEEGAWSQNRRGNFVITAK